MLKSAASYVPINMEIKAKLAILCLAAAALACVPAAAQDPNTMVGKPAPKLQTAQWLNSKPTTLAKLKGKVVVLDFWAYW